MGELMRRYNGMGKNYMYMIRGSKGGYALMDGERARAGGAKCANDARGLRQGNNARFYDDGALRVSMWSEVAELRAGMSTRERRDAEITWSYGAAYWRA